MARAEGTQEEFSRLLEGCHELKHEVEKLVDFPIFQTYCGVCRVHDRDEVHLKEGDVYYNLRLG